MSAARPHVVVVGGGFAGFYAARTLERVLPRGAADLTVISATDHLCYSPLLPEVAAGRLDPRRIAVPLHSALRRARIIQGVVDEVDVAAGTLSVTCGLADPLVVPYDRLALTVGSVTRRLSTPGMGQRSLGLKTLVQAVYIRDHVLRQLELADATQDLAERRARLTFVVVGAGYAGTETAAQLQVMTQSQLDRFPRLRQDDVTWILVDVAPAVLPELGPRLGRFALDQIRRRGMRVLLETSVQEILEDRVTLSDGTVIPCHTVLWTAGVTPPPLVGQLGLDVARGRVVVDAELRVTGSEHVWAGGDAASTPDPFSDAALPYPPTAQHAQRQGVVLGRNIAASLGHGEAGPYRHHDLGLVADLGRRQAVARPLGVPLTGLPAKVVAKVYHLYAVPSMANRARIAADWALNLVSRPVPAQLGLVRPDQARFGRAEHTEREPAGA
ncbi:FAD-dependent oxidoreductase [Cellulomonas sp.]|uniref:NAD(P)/FAD-dependent oxidoreductase n=1 Tax=Cellulomonas sp. TaxID=40001 RepID=UPI001B0DBFC8|nr:FAD-dependent oxidoreductase [Cellulomonas sp.]MBO9555963.1 FAD-dependent oxidoreductase [Cellulomonas sp.]